MMKKTKSDSLRYWYVFLLVHLNVCLVMESMFVLLNVPGSEDGSSLALYDGPHNVFIASKKI